MVDGTKQESVSIEPVICDGQLPYPWGGVEERGEWRVWNRGLGKGRGVDEAKLLGEQGSKRFF